MIASQDPAEKLPVDFHGELLGIIDNFLSGISGRSLIDSGEVQDFCLDLRLIVSSYMPKDDKEEAI